MNDQIVSLAAEKGILAIRPRKPQSIISDVGRRSITDHILTVSDGKDKSIQPLVTAKTVIACPPLKNIDSSSATERIITGSAVQNVIS